MEEAILQVAEAIRVAGFLIFVGFVFLELVVAIIYKPK